MRDISEKYCTLIAGWLVITLYQGRLGGLTGTNNVRVKSKHV